MRQHRQAQEQERKAQAEREAAQAQQEQADEAAANADAAMEADAGDAQEEESVNQATAEELRDFLRES
eukprot:3055999-Pyramimonas_sp.AAC.1